MEKIERGKDETALTQDSPPKNLVSKRETLLGLKRCHT